MKPETCYTLGVIPAKAGIQGHAKAGAIALDSGLRRNDGLQPGARNRAGNRRAKA
jgi:hypothetical protein